MTSLEDLARQILGAHANDHTVADLDACLNHGNGVTNLGNGRGLLVLRDITQITEPGTPEFLPTIIGIATPETPKRGVIGGMPFVSKFWRDIGDRRGLADQRPEGTTKPIYRQWAPVATRSTALAAIGGPLGPVQARTPDISDSKNTYEWHDLTGVPVGGVVYRVSGDGNVTAFHRLTDGPKDLWVKLGAGGSSRRNYGESLRLVREYDFSSFTYDPTLPYPLAFDPEKVSATLRSQA